MLDHEDGTNWSSESKPTPEPIVSTTVICYFIILENIENFELAYRGKKMEGAWRSQTICENIWGEKIAHLNKDLDLKLRCTL